MIGTAKHKRRATFSQCDQQIVAVDKAMRIADHGGYVINRRTPAFLAFVTDDEEPAIKRKIAAITTNLDDSSDHFIPESQDR